MRRVDPDDGQLLSKGSSCGRYGRHSIFKILIAFILFVTVASEANNDGQRSLRHLTSSHPAPCEWLHISGSPQHSDVMGLYQLNASNSSTDEMDAVWYLESASAVLYFSRGAGDEIIAAWSEWVIAAGPNVTIGASHTSSNGVILYAQDSRPMPSAGSGVWYDVQRSNAVVPTLKVECVPIVGVHDAVQAKRELVSFGNNFFGQLRRAQGMQTNDMQNTGERVGVFGEHTASSLSISCNHGLVIADDGKGTVWSWGSNMRGELASEQGLGLAGANPNPYTVNLGGRKSISVAAGGYFSIALVQTIESSTSAGILVSWGSNLFGALGRSSPSGAVFDHRPADITAITASVKTVRAGRNHAMAIDESGAVWSWGSNKEGQLGRVTQGLMDGTPATVPAASCANKRIKEISLGRYHRYVYVCTCVPMRLPMRTCILGGRYAWKYTSKHDTKALICCGLHINMQSKKKIEPRCVHGSRCFLLQIHARKCVCLHACMMVRGAGIPASLAEIAC
jgi:hypothetical protein